MKKSIVFVIMLLLACQPLKSINDYEIESTHVPEILPTPATLNSETLAPDNLDKQIATIELPSWAKDPEHSLILFTYTDSNDEPTSFGLINPENGDKAIYKLWHKAYYYTWKDKYHVVFYHDGHCEEAQKYITEFDLLDSTLTEYKADKYKYEPLRCYKPEDSEKIGVRINRNLIEPTIEVYSLNEGWMKLTNSYDGYSDISFQISPQNDYLAVVQYSGVYEFSELYRPEYGEQISIFDLKHRKLILKYNDEKLISTAAFFLDNSDFIYMRENTPCLIMIPSLVKRCINIIPNDFPDSTIILGAPLLDPEKFAFIYFGHGERGSALCFYSLRSGGVNCPTDKFEELDRQSILRYSLSPNEQFVMIFYSDKGCPVPWCDYSGDWHLGIIDLAQNTFFELKDYKNTRGVWADDAWRP